MDKPTTNPQLSVTTTTQAHARSAPRAATGPWGHELVLHLGLLLTVLVATFAGYQSSRPIHLQADDDLQQSFFGFHGSEQDTEGQAFRWTNGDSTICIDEFGRAQRSAVSLTLMGQYAVPLGNDRVTLQSGGQQLTTVALPPTTRHYHLLVAQPARAELCLNLTSTTVQPTGEPRLLGVQFQALTASRLTNAGWVLPAGWQLLLNSLLALLVFWLLRGLGLRALWAAVIVAGLALLLGSALWLELIVPGSEAARSLLLLVGGLGMLLASGWGYVQLERTRLYQPAWLQHQLTRDLLLMVVWSVVLVLGVWALQEMHGRHGVWPLKAGVWPGFTPWVWVAFAAFVPWLAVVLIQLHRDVAAPWLVVLTLLIGAIALSILLKVSVRGWFTLYTTFANNPADYIHDVPLIGNDPLGFLGSYVERSPTLAWHNANHPPGSVLLLWGVAGLFGPGTIPASWVAIVLSSLGVLAAWWLGLRLGGWRLALLAGALLVVMPGYTVYSVTSMDGVFNGLMALAAVAFFVAFEPGAHRWQALLAGSLIALALFFTYATTQLFFFGLAVCGLALLRQPGPLRDRVRFVVLQSALVVAVLVGLYYWLYLLSGFNIVAATIQAKANNARLLGDPAELNPTLMGLPTVAHYLYYLGVNIVPFLWYLAPWGLAALTPMIWSGARQWRRPDRVTVVAVALIGVVLGMWLSGLFVREVERIWGFSYPMAAVLIGLHVWQGETSRERLWRAGLWISLFFAQSAVMRMLLNLYW